MDFEQLKKEVTSTYFISTYITVFIILFIFTSLIKFIGSLPMLLILTFILTWYVVKKGEKISQSEVNLLYKKMEDLNTKKSDSRMKFFKSIDDILDPSQQIMYLTFEPYLKEQAQKGMKERYRKKPNSKMKQGKRRR